MDDLRLPLGKACSKCGEWKLYDEFHRDKNHSTGRRSNCSKCVSGYRHTYYTNNAEYLREQSLDYYRAHTEYVKQRVREYGKANACKIAQRSKIYAKRRPEVGRKAKAAYKKRNPEQCLLHVHNRRARMLSAGGTHTVEEWEALCQKYEHKCLACGAATKLTRDHVLPIAKGGTNDIGNIQCLCGPCNQSKNDQHIDYRPRQ